MAFLARITKSFQMASVKLSTVTSLHIHSELVLQGQLFADWVICTLPALRSIDIIIDVSLPNEKRIFPSVWHLGKGRLQQGEIFNTVRQLAPLAIVAQHVQAVRFTVVAPPSGLCTCGSLPVYGCEKPPVATGTKYHDLLWLYLRG